MPLVAAPRRQNEQTKRICELITSQEKPIATENDDEIVEDVEDFNDEECIDESDLWLVKYDELAQKSKNIPLSHMGCCKEGAELFSDLCMWVDINQQYVDLGLFPQWDDIARELHIDEMKTEWVRVCVRPEQSFTRAILEIYMADGGTLGDVISALRKQKQFRIIQEISDKAEEFLDVYTTYHKNSYNPNNKSDNNQHLYSILNTLFECFSKAGQEDPLSKFQLYSGGFKSYLKTLNDPKLMGPVPGQGLNTDLIVNSLTEQTTGNMDSQDSGYTSPFRYGGILPSMSETDHATSVTNIRSIIKSEKAEKPKSEDKFEKLTNVEGKPSGHVIRILLIFARDGANEADLIATQLINFGIPEFPSIMIDFFRLNEVELWNQLLLNPEACLVKWLDEMDYVMPILTPQFLQDLHNPALSAGPPAPTSPMINKYIYTLLRSEYVSNGCQNIKVRPAIPAQFIEQLYKCKPVMTEPLFKMWKETDLETMKSRLSAMIKMWAKKNDV